MDEKHRTTKTDGYPRSVRILALALIGLGTALAGCAQLKDDLSARSPSDKFGDNVAFRMQLLFNRWEPLDVLAYSRDGDMRARAYRKLREPSQHGGGQKEQDMVVEALSTGARTEKDVVCRLAAVEKLGEFKDPRVPQALTDAFYAPLNLQEQRAIVRVAALQSLARTGDPSTVETLAQALAHDPDKDVRHAAAEGLGRFETEQATLALVRVLREEKRDVALRHQAHQSLKQITKRDLPPRAEAWEEFFRQPTPPDGRQAKEGKRFFDLASWLGTDRESDR